MRNREQTLKIAKENLASIKYLVEEFDPELAERFYQKAIDALFEKCDEEEKCSVVSNNQTSKFDYMRELINNT